MFRQFHADFVNSLINHMEVKGRVWPVDDWGGGELIALDVVQEGVAGHYVNRFQLFAS